MKKIYCSLDGKYVYCLKEKSVLIFDGITEEFIKKIIPEISVIDKFNHSKDNRYLVFANENQIKIWDDLTNEFIRELDSYPLPKNYHMSDDSSLIAYHYENNDINIIDIIDIKSGQTITKFKIDLPVSEKITSIKFSTDKQKIIFVVNLIYRITKNNNDYISLIEIKSGIITKIHTGCTIINAVHFAPDDKHLIICDAITQLVYSIYLQEKLYIILSNTYLLKMSFLLQDITISLFMNM